MDILNYQDGSTIIENLVAVVLIGIVLGLSTAFLTSVASKTNIRRSAAYCEAEQELFNTINKGLLSDTLYCSENENFQVSRLTEIKEDFTNIEVTVYDKAGQILVQLKSTVANEQE